MAQPTHSALPVSRSPGSVSLCAAPDRSSSL